jgi:CelD/BcsL family acetyltransferase involved in cellulose biosynthesis
MSGLRHERVDPLADERWLALVRRSVDAGPFHHPLWLELLQAQYGLGISGVCVVSADGGLAAGLPVARIESRLTGTRLVALPFSDLCLPAVSDAAPKEARAALADALAEEQRRAGVELEIRAPLPGLRGAQPGRPFLHHVLPLYPDAAAVQSRFSKSQIRRGIKKAQREGVEITFAADRAALDEFFRLHVRTRHHQGIPTQPKRFIRRFERLFQNGLGWVALARWQGTTIAAAVFLSFNGTVVYKYGASDRRHLDKRPNNLLFAEVIRRACAERAHTLDFGRTDPENEGLAAFKRAWGSEERQLTYLRLTRHANRDGAEAGGVPAPVQKLIWRSPPVVGRLIGAALYRHFG